MVGGSFGMHGRKNLLSGCDWVSQKGERFEAQAMGFENYMKIHLKEIGCQACVLIDLTQTVLSTLLALHIPKERLVITFLMK